MPLDFFFRKASLGSGAQRASRSVLPAPERSWRDADIPSQQGGLGFLQCNSAPRVAAFHPCFCTFLNDAMACFVLSVEGIGAPIFRDGHASFLIELLKC